MRPQFLSWSQDGQLLPSSIVALGAILAVLKFLPKVVFVLQRSTASGGFKSMLAIIPSGDGSISSTLATIAEPLMLSGPNGGGAHGFSAHKVSDSSSE